MKNTPGRRDSIVPLFSQREVEAQLLETLESFGYGFFTCDAAWRFDYVSARAERFLGVDEREALKGNLWELFPVSLGTLLEHEYRRTATGEIRDFEYFYEPRHRWYHFRCFPRTKGGISVYFQNITNHKLLAEELKLVNDNLERRVAERTAELERTIAALHRSEEKYRSLVETTNECFWEVDVQGRYTYLSPRFLDMTGYPPEEFIGRSPLDLLPDDGDADQAREMLCAAFAARQPFSSFEQRVRHHDGRVVIAEVSGVPLFSDAGQFLGMRGVCRDITERKRAEERVRESEEHFRTLAAATFEGIAITEAARFIDVNEQFAHMLGYEPSELVGIELAALIPPEHRERVLDNIVNGSESWVEHTMIRRDGTLMTVEAHGRTATYHNRRVRIAAVREPTVARPCTAS